jgi:tellurite resistance protein
MPLSPEQEWTLAACGLMAHADGVLEAEEFEQVLWMLDERIDASDSATWVARLQDAAALEAHIQGLALPPPLFSEDILAKAWRMALADGRGTEQEVAVLERIATMLGERPESVGQWRAQWTEQAQSRSELIAGFAALIAQADGTVSDAERASFDAMLARLPLREGTAPAMRNLLDEPPEMMLLVGGFAALPPEERRIAMLDLVPIVSAEGRDEAARRSFIELAEAIAIDPAEAGRMLDR